MALLGLPKDIQAMLLRLTASLDGLDDARRDAQQLIRNADAAITEVRQVLAGVRAGLAQIDKTPK